MCLFLSELLFYCWFDRAFCHASTHLVIYLSIHLVLQSASTHPSLCAHPTKQPPSIHPCIRLSSIVYCALPSLNSTLHSFHYYYYNYCAFKLCRLSSHARFVQKVSITLVGLRVESCACRGGTRQSCSSSVINFFILGLY